MLATLVAILYVVTRRVSELSFDFFSKEQQPVPYQLQYPLPWHVLSVSQSRRSSRAEGPQFDSQPQLTSVSSVIRTL
ncbi:unnamed protein product [Lampetra planeri]